MRRLRLLAHRAPAVLLLALLLAGVLAAAPPKAPKEPPVPPGDPVHAAAWAEIEKLIAEDRPEEAARKAAEVRAAAWAAGHEEDWTRALIQEAQLRVLRQREGAARLLLDEPWPENPLDRAVLHLYLAQAIRGYHQAYSWEIGQRERVDRPRTETKLDLETATREELFAAMIAQYLEVWRQRESLSAVPVSKLVRYVLPGDYPPEVRGTVRDAVSYLFAETLADTSFWSPRESNEVYRLDLPSLIEGKGGDPADPEAHPLARLASVLGDLEAWHREEGRRAAALEARLERLRRLRAAFSKQGDRELLRRDLEEELPSFREVPWWSMGMATLAEFVREDGGAGHLVRAWEIARAGHAAYPKSPGGLRSLDIARAIEAPDFQLQTMTSDGPGRRSIRVQHKNLEAVWFRLYAFDPLQEVAKSGTGFLFHVEEKEVERLLKGKPMAEWRVDLPPTPDFEFHTTHVVPPVERPGAYLVVASARPDFRRQGNRRAAATLLLSDLVLRSQGADGGTGIVAFSGSTGRPRSGVEVRLYADPWRGTRLLKTQTTGPDGRLLLRDDSGEGFVILARDGGDFAFLWGASRWYPGEQEGASVLVYTDRAIYRPHQKILWKTLAYRRNGEGVPTLNPGSTMTVALVDPNHQEVSRQVVTTNEFGTASGEVVIPPGRPLGHWRLQTYPDGSAAIRVEEYKRPTFEVTLDDPKGPLRLNRPAAFTGRARYYFGLPVVNGALRWQAWREPVAPDWWWHWYGGGFRRDSQVVASGTAELSEDGSFQVEFTPEADEGAEDSLTYRYRVTAEVTDEGGETREAERVFRLGQVSVEARIEPAADFFMAGRPNRVKVVRTDLNGVPRPGAGTWTLFELRQPERTLLPADQPIARPPAEEGEHRTPGDLLRPRDEPGYSPEEVLRLWEDGPRVDGGRLEHGPKGEAELELPAGLPPGAYRLRYETPDDGGEGERAETSLELIVAGPRTPLALPAVLKVDRSEAKVGGTIRLLAHSGLEDQPMFLEIYRSGRLLERRALESDRDSSLIEIPVREEHQGGLGFKLLVLRDHQLMDLSASAFVPWERELAIELSTFRDRVRPGAHETWRVTVRAPEGSSPEAAAAEVLAYMYDRSLDLFARQAPPRPIDLFPNRTGLPQGAASLGSRYGMMLPGEGWDVMPQAPELRTDRLRFAIWPLNVWTRLLTTTSGVLADRVNVGGNEQGQAVANMQRRGAEGVAVGTTAADLAPEAEQAAASPPPPPPPAPAAPGMPQAQPGAPLRSDFAETALWAPHLLTGPDGSAVIELTLPDSVTSWNLWIHAVTRDLRSGSLLRQVESVKDLMVRPYLPRFLREGDRAELEVVVNNASGAEIRGNVDFDIVDPETGESRLAEFGLDRGEARRPFTVKAGGGASLTFPVTAPPRVGPVAFRVTAAAGDVSDGELRPLPVLPSRLHLAQSRFVALRGKGGDRREMTFADLAKDDDPTRIDEQMVVTLDAQLFYSVLQALPYLVNFPYECTEQTLNRFLSTGIVASVFDDYPAVAEMARQMASRNTRFETWDTADPNRKMALEETPWLEEARGGRDGGEDRELLRVLDPRIARAERDSALAKLQKAQLPSGAFPWWPGGPPSPYMTAYILYGFAKALEHGVEVPRPMVERAWQYLGEHFRATDWPALKKKTCCWEGLVLLNYVVTAYPDPSWTKGGPTPDQQKAIADATFRNRQTLSPYLKAMLALTLKRLGRREDGLLVLDGLLDVAKTTPEEGTFWAPEDRAWLWYNDTVEGHALVLRALMDLRPEDPRKDGMVQWLFLNKKLNHWKSTRATAEAIYALVHYLEKEGQLGTREAATVHIGKRTERFTFEPDRYTGKRNQVVVPGEEIDPATSSTVDVEKETPGFLFASATWHFSTEELPKEERGDLFGVSRRYFRRVKTDREIVLQPLAEGDLLRPGDEVEVQLAIRSRAPAEYVHLRDPRAAGLEPDGARSGYRWDLGIARYEETRDSGTNFFFENLPAGEYTLKYRLRANVAGTFRTGPATLQSMYAPEFNAYSTGAVIRVGEGAP